MVPIKIECECGQHYAFDVEPVNGRMPSRVACPSCGIDGTGTANDTIARHLGAPPEPIIRLVEGPAQTPQSSTIFVAPPPPPLARVAPAVESPVLTSSSPRLSVAANSVQRTSHAPAPGRPDPRLGLVDHTQAEHEARAKAMWGDTKEQIVSYLMIQGFSAPEANDLATKLFKERASAVREKGIRKIIFGTGLMCIPVVALFGLLAVHARTGLFLLKPFALAVMAGLYGLWLFVNGLLMALAPKSERGSVADSI